MQPPVPLGRPFAVNLLQLFPEFRHPAFDMPAVQIDFLLPETLVGHRTAGAALTAEIGMHADQPRKQIGKPGGLHLQRRLPRPGPVREDLQNDCRAVQHLGFKRSGQIPELHRRQSIVKDDQIDAGHLKIRVDFSDLARADQRARDGLRKVLGKGFRHGKIRGFTESACLGEGLFESLSAADGQSRQYALSHPFILPRKPLRLRFPFQDSVPPSSASA